MRKPYIAFLIMAWLFAGCHEHPESDATQTIITVERAALERWGKGDPQGFFEIMAPEQTYFDPTTAKRIDGQAALKKYIEPFTGKIKIDRVDMIDPKVQQSGEIAVLTFNLVDYGARLGDGPKTTARWNSTEVYQRFDGSWKIIHSHWSYLQPKISESAAASVEDVQAIRKSEVEWAKAWTGKNIDGVVSHYADDASVELADVPIISGTPAIRSALKQAFADSNFTLSLQPVQVEVSKSGDLAYSRGTYTSTISDTSTRSPKKAKGKYVLVYRKQPDGRWLVIHDINNRDSR
jgi:uncharacterized protein (TIGR02246 family)